MIKQIEITFNNDTIAIIKFYCNNYYIHLFDHINDDILNMIKEIILSHIGGEEK